MAAICGQIDGKNESFDVKMLFYGDDGMLRETETAAKGKWDAG